MIFAVMESEKMEWIVESESLSDFVDHGWYTISSKPLVRCKDCKFFENGNPCGIVDWWNTSEDYCSRGERKDGGAEDGV